MPTRKTAQMPTASELEAALSELLEELLAYRARQQSKPRKSSEIEIVIMDLTAPLAVHEANSWASNPVDRALQRGMKTVGQLLFNELGSLSALGDVFERVCGRPDTLGYYVRASVLDHALDGVGNEQDCWAS